MPFGGHKLSLDQAPTRRARHFLPGHRQKIPPKLLKNKENTPPGSFDRRVQRSEAAWDVHLRRFGLEIWE
jgi:hypothetical protein